MEIVNRIIELKKKNDWSDYRLSKKAGISQSTLSNLINRGNSPSIFTLEKICNAFEITLAQFFDEDSNTQVLTEKQRDLLNDWNHLKPDQKDKVKAYMRGMLDQ